VLWAAGVAASPLVRTLGVPLDRAGRALVEPDLSIAGHPEVFVVGDAASFVHTGDGVPLPGVVQPATQGAAHAARTILRRERGEPSRPFAYRDLGNMAIVGRASAIADCPGATERMPSPKPRQPGQTTMLHSSRSRFSTIHHTEHACPQSGSLERPRGPLAGRTDGT
jgi:NADH dehydrogenase FAD-containing subunit